jgi:hypothetical protein
VLKKKNVLLFISGLDISNDEISILKPIHDALRKEDQYKIVWIPIVERWNDGMRKKFEILQSKMPYMVHSAVLFANSGHKVHQAGLALQEQACYCGDEPTREGGMPKCNPYDSGMGNEGLPLH